MAQKERRILITGGAGFVGSHLAAELRRQGAEVITLDARGEDSIDIREWTRVRDFADELGRLDVVYHLAALMFVPYSFEDPRSTYEANVLGTLNVLELCRLQRVEKLVFASSYVYGQPEYLPIDEEHPLNPTNPYARSKVVGETLCKAYHDDFGLNCTILRLFNVYGEGQGDDFLIPSVLKQLASGKIELMDPEPKRDFLYMGDAIEAYVRAGKYDKSDFEVFNIGSGVSHSVDSIVRRIVESWGQEVKITYKRSRRKGEIMNVVADIGKAREQLGWEPVVDFGEGLRRCIEWHKAQLKPHI